MNTATLTPSPRMESEPRLTSLSHGGGCGCKIAPGVLSDILRASSAAMPLPPQLLVGLDTSDDAAVYQLNETQALVATTDFFMPIVDDPFDFGRIAAANALSDVYAMGGTPVLALSLVGMPIKLLSTQTIGRILEGGTSVCAEAGVPVAGGHTIDSVEPIYGLVAMGIVHPDRLKKNSAAQAGDVLILGKGIGVGVLSAALKKGQLPASGYEALMASATQLNVAGPRLAALPGVHAMTDVTGFALAGHTLEMARSAGLTAQLHWPDVPLLPGAEALAAQGLVTGASARNWAAYAEEVALPADFDPTAHALLTDPQTSGGLLVSCSEDSAAQVLALFEELGFRSAATVGRMLPRQEKRLRVSH